MRMMMKHLRRYIRKIIKEAFNTPNPDNIHDRLAFVKAPHDRGNGGFVYAILDPQLVEDALKNVEMKGIKHHGDAMAMVLQGSLLGMMRIDEADLGCNNAYIVDSVAADGGLGPTVYDIVAMDPDLLGGIVADRFNVRDKAKNVWNFYYTKRQEDLESMEPLDDYRNPITQDEDDDCVLSTYHERYSPLLPLLLTASITWLKENFPEHYENAFGDYGSVDASSIAYELSKEYNDELIERSIPRFFIAKVANQQYDDLPIELESQYSDFIVRIDDEPDLLHQYIDIDSEPIMPMNFSYKVKTQPEWYEMLFRGDVIKGKLLDKFDTLTEDYFDDSIQWRTKFFFQERY